MNAIAAILRELAGLFIDDGALAAMAVAWIAICAWLRLMLLPPPVCALLLFAGLAAALAVSVLRT